MMYLPQNERKSCNYIEIFDENGSYIRCPKVGGMVKYRYNGGLYLYKVVDFRNGNWNSDWLNDGDWINPIIEFVSKVE